MQLGPRDPFLPNKLARRLPPPRPRAALPEAGHGAAAAATERGDYFEAFFVAD